MYEQLQEVIKTTLQGALDALAEQVPSNIPLTRRKEKILQIKSQYLYHLASLLWSLFSHSVFTLDRSQTLHLLNF